MPRDRAVNLLIPGFFFEEVRKALVVLDFDF